MRDFSFQVQSHINAHKNDNPHFYVSVHVKTTVAFTVMSMSPPLNLSMSIRYSHPLPRVRPRLHPQGQSEL